MVKWTEHGKSGWTTSLCCVSVDGVFEFGTIPTRVVLQ